MPKKPTAKTTKEEEKIPPISPERVNVIQQEITDEMKKSFIDYAMSVITDRALPDVRDGLKPVHRRVLFAMNELGLTSGAKTRKSAAVVGEVLGNYHPHGDVAAYQTMVKMAQDFVMRYPLIIGQGNWGSIDGDAAAAMRYCVTGDTRITTEHGLIPIQSISKNNKENVSLKILSKDKKINTASKWFDSGDHETIKIKTKKGYAIQGSHNHPILVWARNPLTLEPNFTWKLLSDVKIGDVAVLDRSQDVLWPKKNLNLTSYVPEVKHKRTEIKVLPTTLDENLASILGAFLSEGNITSKKIEFCNSDKVWIDDLAKKWSAVFPDCRLHQFTKQPSSYGKKIYYRLEVHSLFVIGFLKNCGLLPQLSKDKTVPHAIFTSPKSVAAAFLSAYFEGDGSISSSRKMIELSLISKSSQLISEMQILLLRFGIASSQYYDTYRSIHKLYIRSLRDYLLFQETIGFLSLRKKEKMNIAIHSIQKDYSQTDFVPYLQDFTRSILSDGGEQSSFVQKHNFDRYPAMERNHEAVVAAVEPAKKLKVMNIFDHLLSVNYLFDPISSIEETGVERVYSIKVDSTCHSYIGNGFINHNTEAKMSKVSSELLRDIEKETVNFVPNYDGTRKEPTVLPTAVPTLLLNGTLGIAVGMATNIPPHNLNEVMDAVTHLVDNKDATTEDLLQFIKGPDFPIGGMAFNQKDISHAYASGKGGVVTRGEAEVVETKAGQAQIIITSIPYRVNKSQLIEKIADLVREKKIEGIKGLRDESAKDIRVVIDLKGTAHPQTILNYIYKHTQLEEAFHYNMVALVNGVPETLSLKGILEEFVAHRTTVIRRRTEFDLKKALEREHILLGLKKALDHIDAIVKLIRGSKDQGEAHKKLMAEFKFSAIQATAILEMKLSRLAGLERKKIEDELKAVQLFIEEMKAILGSPKKILGIIKTECAEIKEKYGDERRTKIVKGGAKIMSVEDLIPDEENALVLTAGGYIKRTNPDEFRKQKRGGVGVVDLDTKEEDFVTMLLITSTHSDLLFFTDKGKVYQTKMYDIPEGKRATKGKNVMNFLPLSEGEKITSILPMPKEVKKSEASLMMVTKNGIAKKCSAASFHDVRISGIIAIKLETGDALISASFVNRKDTYIIVSAKGQSIHFKESDIRETGRTAMGVRGMKLGKGDTVISAEVVSNALNSATLMVISQNGYGKCSDIDEYKIQNRGGSGIKTANVTAKTGPLISAKIFAGGDDEVVAISKKSQVIRVDSKEIPVLGRQTQGVRIMKLRDGDSIASLICL